MSGWTSAPMPKSVIMPLFRRRTPAPPVPPVPATRLRANSAQGSVGTRRTRKSGSANAQHQAWHNVLKKPLLQENQSNKSDDFKR